MTSPRVTQVVRRQPIMLIAAVIVLALLSVTVYGMARGVGGGNEPGEAVVGDAPPFAVRALDGAPFDLATHADRPILLYFWASWCLPCRSEAPLIQRLWGEYEARGYTFVGMNIWDTEADAKRFAEEFGLTFPVVRDPENRVYLNYGVETLPMAFMIRPGLEIDRRYLGELKEDDLRAMLDRLVEPS